MFYESLIGSMGQPVERTVFHCLIRGKHLTCFYSGMDLFGIRTKNFLLVQKWVL